MDNIIFLIAICSGGIIFYLLWDFYYVGPKKKKGPIVGFRIIKTRNNATGEERWEIEFIDKAGAFVKGHYQRFDCDRHSREYVIEVAEERLADLKPPEITREEVYNSLATDKDGGVSIVEKS